MCRCSVKNFKISDFVKGAACAAGMYRGIAEIAMDKTEFL